MSGGGYDLLIEHSGTVNAAQIMDEMCEVYADVCGVSPDEQKTAVFRGRAVKAAGRAGYDLVAARQNGRLVGFAFGYTLPDGDTY